ncbi:probable proline and glycine rich transmembrane protein gene in bax [Vibrio astriarenae]|nr:probable proline and glycine rich transmembrane protein gene in bax [Vibrio sp. C7]
MAMSHASGLQTKTAHIAKGLQFTVPVILATLAGLLLQGIAGMLLPFVSLYLSLAFTNSTLLICEKRVPPMSSLWLSLRAVNKKILPLAAIYITMMCLFVVGAMLYGVGLIFVLPLFFHVKAIIYREMFGIRLKVIATQDKPSDDDSDDDSSDSTDQDNDNSNDSNGKIFNA